ncbi:hypothetical protein ADICYQ_1211 [Cyclobacterium qasimii M12-11B]|uniref:Uncharacterized protein n=1 Tax=Cyclobacterium qasimii M12-11B TaxID=641524 RepID=S7VK41_9BACT|nr:hypothetical protein ADICYQ_1211 [Cyclobacterium qasimii M12-11B]
MIALFSTLNIQMHKQEKLKWWSVLFIHCYHGISTFLNYPSTGLTNDTHHF